MVPSSDYNTDSDCYLVFDGKLNSKTLHQQAYPTYDSLRNASVWLLATREIGETLDGRSGVRGSGTILPVARLRATSGRSAGIRMEVMDAI